MISLVFIFETHEACLVMSIFNDKIKANYHNIKITVEKKTFRFKYKLDRHFGTERKKSRTVKSLLRIKKISLLRTCDKVDNLSNSR